MPWFSCDDCGDSIKKPKVREHAGRCRARSFTCIDCSRTFDSTTVHAHTSCVTEHEKYAKGATKPGGFAAAGFHGEARQGPAPAAAAAAGGELPGAQYLATRPPWRCSLCNVGCTSAETLAGHANGAKHVRKARAALAAKQQQGSGAEVAAAPEPAAAPAPEPEQQPGGGKRKAEGGVPAENGAAGKRPKAGGEAKPPKWKKLAAKELEGAGGSAKLKKLTRAVLAAAGPAGAADGAAAALLAALEGSARFEVNGKTVRLRQ